MAAINVLHRHAPNSKIILPNLDLIGQGMEDGFVIALLEEIFHTKIKEFMLTGHLYCVHKLFAVGAICHQ